jgi:hypothetical protein
MSTEVLLTALISAAAVIVSATQILVAHLNKSKEMELARMDQDRQWRLNISEFLISHMEQIFSNDLQTRTRVRDVVRLAFPAEITAMLFTRIDRMALEELFSPLVLQFKHTTEAFERWSSKNLYRDTKIIRDGNTIARDLLIDRAHLVPPDLAEDARKLIEHYDRWLEEYQRRVGDAEPDDNAQFPFAGPMGHPFPIDSKRRFVQQFEMLERSTRT